VRIQGTKDHKRTLPKEKVCGHQKGELHVGKAQQLADQTKMIGEKCVKPVLEVSATKYDPQSGREGADRARPEPESNNVGSNKYRCRQNPPPLWSGPSLVSVILVIAQMGVSD